MTDDSGKFWRYAPGSYIQPRVIEPPLNQNVNNSRHAIWHLGREFDIEVYPTRQGWRVGDDDQADDGLHDRGEPRIIRVRGVIQPYNRLGDGSSNLVTESFGERSEGLIMVDIDSHQPFNIDAAQQNPDIFTNGIRIHGPDTEGTDSQYNFQTVILFRNRKWKVIQVDEMFESGNEELHFQGCVYRCVCAMMRDRSHERKATPEISLQNNEVVWGPE